MILSHDLLTAEHGLASAFSPTARWRPLIKFCFDVVESTDSIRRALGFVHSGILWSNEWPDRGERAENSRYNLPISE